MTISKSALKAQMLEVFRSIETSGEELIITDHNRPVLVVSTYKPRPSLNERCKPWFGKALFNADPSQPTQDEWENS